MHLTQDQARLALYAVRDLIARRTLGGQAIPTQFHGFAEHLATCAYGSESDGHGEQLELPELIDTTEAAMILHCSTSWVRQIRTDLDGQNIGGRWVFARQTVLDYADAKGNH